jgi:hypothetical protein
MITMPFFSTFCEIKTAIYLCAAGGGDREEGYFVAGDGLAKRALLDELALLVVLEEVDDVVHEVGVGVGEGVREKDDVVVEGERVLEGEREVGLRLRAVLRLKARNYPAKLVLAVGDVLAAAEPLLYVVVAQHFREDHRLQALAEQAARLHQVQDVEFERLVFLRVFHREEKPLRVALRVDVVLQNQVVFELALLERAEEVA